MTGLGKRAIERGSQSMPGARFLKAVFICVISLVLARLDIQASSADIEALGIVLHGQLRTERALSLASAPHMTSVYTVRYLLGEVLCWTLCRVAPQYWLQLS